MVTASRPAIIFVLSLVLICAAACLSFLILMVMVVHIIVWSSHMMSIVFLTHVLVLIILIVIARIRILLTVMSAGTSLIAPLIIIVLTIRLVVLALWMVSSPSIVVFNHLSFGRCILTLIRILIILFSVAIAQSFISLIVVWVVHLTVIKSFIALCILTSTFLFCWLLVAPITHWPTTEVLLMVSMALISTFFSILVAHGLSLISELLLLHINATTVFAGTAKFRKVRTSHLRRSLSMWNPRRPVGLIELSHEVLWKSVRNPFNFISVRSNVSNFIAWLAELTVCSGKKL